VKRYRARHPATSGHLYQGRYKSFVVDEDEYLLTLLRYVEANALRAGLVARAEAWTWSSLGCDRRTAADLLSDWPVDRPVNWAALVNRPMAERRVAAIRTSIARDRPFGDPKWVHKVAAAMGLEFTLRPRGRPKKVEGIRWMSPFSTATRQAENGRGQIRWMSPFFAVTFFIAVTSNEVDVTFFHPHLFRPHLFPAFSSITFFVQIRGCHLFCPRHPEVPPKDLAANVRASSTLNHQLVTN